MAQASSLVTDGVAPHLAAVGDSEAERVALELWQRACANDKLAVERLLNPLLSAPDPRFLREVEFAMAQVVNRACRKATLASLPAAEPEPKPKELPEKVRGVQETSPPSSPVPAGPTFSSPATSRNPYRELLNLAYRVHEEELARASSFAGKRREAPPEWGPRFRVRETELQGLFDDSLLAAEKTGFGVGEVERRVRALVDAVLAIALWQRDAPTLSPEERRTMEFSGIWHDPACDYFSEHYRRMMDAWQPVNTLAVRAGGGEATREEHQPTVVAPPATPVPPTSSKASGGSAPEPIPAIDPEAQALALLFQQPEWSVAQIADHLNVDRKTPYKWKKFRAAAELRGKLKPRGLKDQTPRRGHKTADGQVEAYADEDEDE
jgi:hypothetical protein